MVFYRVHSGGEENRKVFLRIMLPPEKQRVLQNLRRRFSGYTSLFYYLIEKYHIRLRNLSPEKRSSVRKYQMRRGDYRNTGIRVALAVHQFLKDFSDITGFSMSALVGFLLEWENETESQEDREERQGLSVITIRSVRIRHVFSFRMGFVREGMSFAYG